MLLAHEADTHLYDSWYPVIFTALDIKEHEIFEMLLKYCSEQDIKEKLVCDNGNLLHAAVRSGSLEAVKQVCELFQKYELDMNVKNKSEGLTPLHLAVRCVSLKPNQSSLFANLKFKDSQANGKTLAKRKNGSDKTNILQDSYAEMKALAGTLISKNTDVHGKRNNVIMEHNLHILKHLLHLGLDVNAQNLQESTALHEAAKMGYADECRLLLEHGANPMLVDKNAQIPWLCALHHNHHSVMEVLSEKSEVANVEIDGQSLLHLACASGSLACVKNLVGKGLEAKKQDCEGLTPLMVAIQNRRIDCVKYLLDTGNTDCGVNMVSDVKNTSALQIALEACSSPMVFPYIDQETIPNALVNGGADVNIRDREGFTPLLRLHDNNFAWKWLVKNGADLNAVAANGQNILHLHVKMNGISLSLNCLLEHNIDVGKLSACVLMPEEHTPLMTAILNGNSLICQFLLNAGASCCLLKKWQENGIFKKIRKEKDNMGDVLDRIESEVGQVASLQDLGRQALLNTLGVTDVDRKVKELNLPVMVHQYMKWPVFMKWKECCWYDTDNRE